MSNHRKNRREVTETNPKAAGRPTDETMFQVPADYTNALKLAQGGSRGEALREMIERKITLPSGIKLTDDVLTAILSEIASGSTVTAAAKKHRVNPAAIYMRCMRDQELRNLLTEARGWGSHSQFDSLMEIVERDDLSSADKRLLFDVIKHYTGKINKVDYGEHQAPPTVAIQINYSDDKDDLL